MWVLRCITNGLFVEVIHGVIYLSFCEHSKNALKFSSLKEASDWMKILQSLTRFGLEGSCIEP